MHKKKKKKNHNKFKRYTDEIVKKWPRAEKSGGYLVGRTVRRADVPAAVCLPGEGYTEFVVSVGRRVGVGRPGRLLVWRRASCTSVDGFC